MKWKIEFFNEKVEKETLSFPPKILAKLIHIFEMIEIVGIKLGEPYTKPVKDGLFEIRVKGNEGIARCIYCYQKNRTIIILHSFIKKSQKTPKKEIETALARKKEVDSE